MSAHDDAKKLSRGLTIAFLTLLAVLAALFATMDNSGSKNDPKPSSSASTRK